MSGTETHVSEGFLAVRSFSGQIVSQQLQLMVGCFQSVYNSLFQFRQAVLKEGMSFCCTVCFGCVVFSSCAFKIIQVKVKMRRERE